MFAFFNGLMLVVSDIIIRFTYRFVDWFSWLGSSNGLLLSWMFRFSIKKAVHSCE